MRRLSLLLVLSLCGITTAQQANRRPTPAAPRNRAARPVQRQSRPNPVDTKDAKGTPPQVVQETFHPVDPDAPVELVRERFDNGRVRIEREVTLDVEGNYIRHGQWKQWDVAGQEVAFGKFHENRRHGRWVRVVDLEDVDAFEKELKGFTGPFVSQAEFEHGEMNGQWQILDNEGKLLADWHYENGKRHGTWTWQFPNGKPMRQITYVDGLIDGPLRVWDASGELTADHTYRQGRRIAVKTEQYDSGKKKSEGGYLLAKRELAEADDWWNTKLARYTTVGQDDRHGSWISWHESGQMESEGSFDHGLKNGQITWWYPNGQTKLAGGYEMGRPIGDWVWWHRNGQKATVGQYQNGEPSGGWVYWSESGQLVQRSDLSLAGTVVEPQQDAEPKTSARPGQRR